MNQEGVGHLEVPEQTRVADETRHLLGRTEQIKNLIDLRREKGLSRRESRTWTAGGTYDVRAEVVRGAGSGKG